MSDSIPVTSSERFTSGHLLGSFPGPATANQIIHITGVKLGKHVVIQHSGSYLHFPKVSVFGRKQWDNMENVIEEQMSGFTEDMEEQQVLLETIGMSGKHIKTMVRQICGSDG